MDEKAITDLAAALSLAEPPGIRGAGETDTEVVLKILQKYSDYYGAPDMSLARLRDDDELAVLLTSAYELGALETCDFEK